MRDRRKSRVSEYAHIMIAHRGLVLYRVGAPGWRAAWNKYPGHRAIGFGVVTGRVCWSIVWGRL